MKDGLSRIKAKASRGFHVCEEKSRDLVSSFMGLFGRDGRIVSHCQWGNNYKLANLLHRVNSFTTPVNR